MLVNKGTIPVILILFALASCGGSRKSGKKADIMPGTWQALPITIDGDSKDWPSPYPNYDSKAKIAYATSNDMNYLYVTVESGDELTQMKILKAGMTVSIDTGGKKNADFSITYPMENDNDPLDLPTHGSGEKNSAMHTEKMLTRQISKATDQAVQLTLAGFYACNGGYAVTQVLPCGIKIKARIDEYKELIWEAAIPFKAIYNRDAITAVDAGKHISVCFTLKGLKAPKSQGVDNMNGNSGGSGMGAAGGQHNSMMGGGGGRGGRSGGGKSPKENPLEQLYTSTKTWKFFGLAVQP